MKPQNLLSSSNEFWIGDKSYTGESEDLAISKLFPILKIVADS